MDYEDKIIENFQKSWDTHMEAFGPILGPAFMQNFEARVHLTAALNSLSKGKTKTFFANLSHLKDFCSSDEDCAAWFFFMGLGFELSGMKEEMLRYYNECIKYSPSFSMPYLMVAKCAHANSNLSFAEENYRKALELLENENLPAQTALVKASAYTNYFSCLTSLGKYSEAESALKKSEEILPDFTLRLHYAAILYAYMGNEEKLSEYLLRLRKENKELYDSTVKLIDNLSGK